MPLGANRPGRPRPVMRRCLERVERRAHTAAGGGADARPQLGRAGDPEMDRHRHARSAQPIRPSKDRIGPYRSLGEARRPRRAARHDRHGMPRDRTRPVPGPPGPAALSVRGTDGRGIGSPRRMDAREGRRRLWAGPALTSKAFVAPDAWPAAAPSFDADTWLRQSTTNDMPGTLLSRPGSSTRDVSRLCRASRACSRAICSARVPSRASTAAIRRRC